MLAYHGFGRSARSPRCACPPRWRGTRFAPHGAQPPDLPSRASARGWPRCGESIDPQQSRAKSLRAHQAPAPLGRAGARPARCLHSTPRHGGSRPWSSPAHGRCRSRTGRPSNAPTAQPSAPETTPGVQSSPCAHLLIRKVDQKVLRRSIEPATYSVEKLEIARAASFREMWMQAQNPSHSRLWTNESAYVARRPLVRVSPRSKRASRPVAPLVFSLSSGIEFFNGVGH